MFSGFSCARANRPARPDGSRPAGRSSGRQSKEPPGSRSPSVLTPAPLLLPTAPARRPGSHRSGSAPTHSSRRCSSARPDRRSLRSARGSARSCSTRRSGLLPTARRELRVRGGLARGLHAGRAGGQHAPVLPAACDCAADWLDEFAFDADAFEPTLSSANRAVVAGLSTRIEMFVLLGLVCAAPDQHRSLCARRRLFDSRMPSSGEAAAARLTPVVRERTLAVQRDEHRFIPHSLSVSMDTHWARAPSAEGDA